MKNVLFNSASKIFPVIILLGFLKCNKIEDPFYKYELAIENISPTGGPAGTEVTITGTGFSTVPDENRVMFNGEEAQVTQATATSLLAEAPAGGTTGIISVAVNGQSAEGPVFTYKEEDQLEIISIQPEGGYPFSSTLCTTTIITGKHFGNKNQDSDVELVDNENEKSDVQAGLGIESWTDNEIKVNFCYDHNWLPYSPMYLRIKQNGKQTGAYIIVQRESDQLGTYDVSTMAGDGAAGFKDGEGVASEFNNPSGMAVDSHGNIFVADELNNRIRKIDPAGNVTTVAGGITNASGSDVGKIDTIQLKRPRGIAIDSHDNIFITQYHVCHILKIDMSAGESSVLAGSDTPGYSDGENTTAQFYYPFGLATDADDNIYVADEYNQRIRKISPTGIVKTVAGDGTVGNQDGNPGNNYQSSFNFPRGVAVNSLGDVFVTDYSIGDVRGIKPDGNVYTLYISFFVEHPTGITVDNKDNIYITSEDDKIYFYYSGMGNTTRPYGILTGNINGYKDGDDASARFSNPYAITADTAGNIYVADNGNARVRKIGLE